MKSMRSNEPRAMNGTQKEHDALEAHLLRLKHSVYANGRQGWQRPRAWAEEEIGLGVVRCPVAHEGCCHPGPSVSDQLYTVEPCNDPSKRKVVQGREAARQAAREFVARYGGCAKFVPLREDAA